MPVRNVRPQNKRRAESEPSRSGYDILADEATQRVRDAAKVVGAERLHALLLLDAPDAAAISASASAAVKASTIRHRQLQSLVGAACSMRRQLREELARSAADEASAADIGVTFSDVWEQTFAIDPVTLAVDLDNTIGRIESTASRLAARVAVEIERHRLFVLRSDDKGARIDGDEISANLVELRGCLRVSDSSRWTIQQLAELILSSSTDWRVAPCPDLASRYRARDARDRPVSLMNWISTRISRAYDKAVRRRR